MFQLRYHILDQLLAWRFHEVMIEASVCRAATIFGLTPSG